ncbi:hypothetical protein [Lacinutrix sp. MedPE-SW]|uniref:hypothetical protein n=1 Tax=Lacinutrix sp. MedPE-SW TaxID=1860087 RepID=UPI0025BDD6AE|nr:hypothetical protein [Lacinutrix sp. MedPE-SW]
MEKNKINIFQSKYLDLFTDFGYGVNSLSDILQSLGYNIENLNSSSGKTEAIDAIGQLLEKEIIYVLHWGKHHNIIKNLDLNYKQTLIFINEIWFENANYSDFLDMVTFKYTDWYYNKLKEAGIDVNTDWGLFGKEFVPNIEEWIKEKRP